MSYRLLDDAPASAPVALPPKGKYLLIEEGAEPPASRAAAIDETLARGSREVGRQVGLTVRAGVKGVTAIPSMVGDALGLRSSGAVDNLMNMVGLPQPENAPERISQDVAGAMAGQGAMAKVAGFLSGPVASRVGQLFTRDPGTQIVAAGGGAGAAGTTREAGGSPAMQALAGFGTAVAIPTAMALRPRSTGMTPREQAVVDESVKHDVPLTFSDVTGKAKRLDTWLEGTPVVGTAKFREEGAKKATAAAERVVEGARTELDQTSFHGLNRLKLAAQGGDKAAKRVLEEIDNAGGDWQKIMQASGNLKLWRSRQAAEELYDRVEKLAQPLGNMPIQRATLALDDAIAAEMMSKLPDQKLLSTMQTLRNNLTNQKTPTDFTAARKLRSDLGDIIENSYKGENALVGAKGVGKLQAVKDALEADMAQFASAQGGALAKAWKRADEFYKTAVVPYKDKALAKALSSDTPDEIYSVFIRTGRSGAGEDRAVKFYQALDQKGQAAVRYGMLSNALDDAAISGKDTISPARFAQSLEKIDPGTGVFFKGDDKKALDGFVNLMRHAERFGQYTENPPTGQRVIPLVSLLGAATWPKLAAVIGGLSLGAREATTRPALRDALIRASNAKMGSVELDQIGKEVVRLAPQVSATSTTSASQQ